MAAGSSRASWQQEACPPWCVVVHTDGDALADRKHVGASHSVPVLALKEHPRPLDEVCDEWEVGELALCYQRRDGSGRTALYIGDGTDQRLELAVDSVRVLCATLADLLERDREPDPQV